MLPITIKFYVMFCILWASALSQGNDNENQVVTDDASELHEALAIIYYPDEDLYTLADTRTIQKMSFRPAFGPNYSHVLLCCPDVDDSSVVKLLHDVKIEIVYKRNFEIRNTRICKHPYKPGCSINQNIGYYVSFWDDILTQNNLPPISKRKGYNDAFIEVIQVDEMYSKILEPIQTTHTFVSYKHFPSTDSLTSCSYPSIPDKRGPNLSKALELHYDEDLTPFYEKKHQDAVLLKFVHQGQYFVRQQLVPIDDFTDEPSRRATCYNMNTVPIWRPIAEGPIKKIEKFIRYIAQMVDTNTLSVTTRIQGDLKLPLINDPSTKGPSLYLDYENRRISVPKIFIKILHYQVRFRRHKNNPNIGQIHRNSFRGHHSEGYETQTSSQDQEVNSDKNETRSADSYSGDDKGQVSSFLHEQNKDHQKKEILSVDQRDNDYKLDDLAPSPDPLVQNEDYEKDDILPRDQQDENDDEEETRSFADRKKEEFSSSGDRDEDHGFSLHPHHQDYKNDYTPDPYHHDNDDKEAETPMPVKHYYILIAVHNELVTPLIDKLCDTDICNANGFIVTKNEDERKMFYCCAMDNLLLPKYESYFTQTEHNFEIFNLNDVPTKVDENGKVLSSVRIPTYLD